VQYPATELDQITLAYACSIHKSQGSEYPAVVIPVHTQHFVMLARNLLYTAVTRGKKLVVLVGSKRAIRLAVRNDGLSHRCSGMVDGVVRLLG
jgi:exodeoxyribonuclease V alpha subunit